MSRGSPIGVKYPPGPQPPEREPESVECTAFWCYECKEAVSGLAENVGETLYNEHRGHLTRVIDEWREDVE